MECTYLKLWERIALGFALLIGGWFTLFFDGGHAYSQATASIAGTVFFDLDGDGQQGPTEPGLGDVTVTLACASTLITATDADGHYTFQDLPGGEYHVAETDPPGYVSTTPNAVQIALAEGGAQGGVDFGDAVPVSVGGTVFQDDDGDGEQTPGERGLGGVALYLYADDDGDGLLKPDDPLVGQTTTDQQGNYIFRGLLPGAYFLVEDDPPGYLNSTPNVVLLRLISSEVSGLTTIDFGDVPARAIIYIPMLAR